MTSRTLENVSRDVVYAWRTLRRSPAFSIVVATTLAIGIGANAAVISVIDTAFLRKLPVPAPNRVIEIFGGDSRDGARRRVNGRTSFPDYRDLSARLAGVQGLAAYAMTSLKLGDTLTGAEAWSAMVTGNYFPLLGVQAARGRLIAADEDVGQGAHPVVVISHTMWMSRFNADDRIVGRELVIGRGRFTIIGVAPPGFTGTHAEGRTNLWIPWTMQAEATGRAFTYDFRDDREAIIVGRLAPGATVEQVQSSADRAVRELAATYPAFDASLRLRVSLHDRLFTTDQNPDAIFPFLLVGLMVALIHLVACSNVTTLMLARVAARRRELGVRLCLGASRGRILMQSLVEPGLLAVLGAAGGVLVARWLTLLVMRMQFLSAMDPGLDGRVVAIVALITAATVVEVGLVPALNASRRDPLTLIRGSSGGRIAGRRDRVGPMLVCAQVAVSLILVSNAAVLVGTFERQARRDLGFDASHLVVADVRWRAGGHPAGDWTSLVGEMTVRAAALPGASRAAVASGAPLVPGGAYQEVVVPGYPYAEGEPRKLSVQFVGPGYFGTIGAALLSGREFAATDRSPESAVGHGFDVVVVNEAFAKRYWPGSDPVGKQVAYHNRGAATVVGVVRDLNDVTVSAVVPRAYFPLFEFPVMSRVDLIVRSRGDPALTQGAVRSVVLSSALPVDPLTVQTMGDVVDDALMISRVGGIGLTACAAVALLLTAIGLYGLVASWSAERRTEIGIRLALGAQVRHVHAVLLGGVGRLVAIGGVVGIGGAVALMRLERAWWGPAIALEPVAVLTGVALFTLVAGIAAFVPSWRATAIAPADVLNAG